jgi:hypothetical protein
VSIKVAGPRVNNRPLVASQMKDKLAVNPKEAFQFAENPIPF